MLQNQTLALWRSAAKSNAALGNVFLAGAERMLDKQAEITRALRAEMADAASEIEAAADVQALLASQGRLMRLQAEKAAGYWAGLYAEVVAAQRAWVRESQQSALDFIEQFRRALDGVPPAPGTEPAVSAMKLVVDATRSSYAAIGGAGAGARTPPHGAKGSKHAAG